MFTSGQRAKRKSCPIKRGYAQLTTNAVASQSDWQRNCSCCGAHMYEVTSTNLCTYALQYNFVARQGQTVVNSSAPQCTHTQHQLHVNARPQRLMTQIVAHLGAPPSYDAQIVALLGNLARAYHTYEGCFSENDVLRKPDISTVWF